MQTLFDELKKVSIHIELVCEQAKEDIQLFIQKYVSPLTEDEQIDIYLMTSPIENLLLKIYTANYLLTNEIVTEYKNNYEVNPNTVEWFERN